MTTTTTTQAPVSTTTHAPDHVEAEDKLANLETAVKETQSAYEHAVGLLRRVQWAGEKRLNPRHFTEGTCPTCKSPESVGHTEACELALEIA